MLSITTRSPILTPKPLEMFMSVRKARIDFALWDKELNAL